MTPIGDGDRKKIADFLKGRHIPSGVGTKEAACSIAAINLALTGELTDRIPDCMSRVIGRWIIAVQDAMPDKMRNSDEWRELLPLAAGTGREFETERRALVMDWMWGTVLPSIQHIADANGFGKQWRTMCAERTRSAAAAASYASDAASAAASYASDAASAAASAAASDAAAASYASDAASAAASYASSASASADADAKAAAWDQFNPVGLLKRLVEVS